MTFHFILGSGISMDLFRQLVSFKWHQRTPYYNFNQTQLYIFFGKLNKYCRFTSTNIIVTVNHIPDDF
jgi:hypothetical protein